MSVSRAEACRRWLNALCEYMDGELDEELCAELERHLAECAPCTTVLETMRHTVALYRRWGRAELPEEGLQRLKSIVHSHLSSDTEASTA